MPERIMAARGKWKCDRWDKKIEHIAVELVFFFGTWEKGDSFQLCYLWVMPVHFDFQVQHFEQTMFALFSKYALVYIQCKEVYQGQKCIFWLLQ